MTEYTAPKINTPPLDISRLHDFNRLSGQDINHHHQDLKHIAPQNCQKPEVVQENTTGMNGQKSCIYLKNTQFYLSVCVITIGILLLLMYILHQSKVIMMLVHELKRIGDGTGFILEQLIDL